MATLQNLKLNFELTLTITEDELRALDGLVGYGYDAFIKKFKSELGSHYIQDHEKGLKNFFETIRTSAPSFIKSLDDIKKLIAK
jgi:hypothetical protein